MEQTRPGESTLHPRLTVSWMDASRRDVLVRSLRIGARAVTSGSIEDRASALAEQRHEGRALATAALLDDISAARAEREASASALGDLLAERVRLLEAAAWCEELPTLAASRSGREAELSAEIDDRSRVARASGRQLERVLEQRASAEHALDEARRELEGLGATGVDETGVRRQLEESSSELRAASAAYRSAMTELARRRQHLAEVETVREGGMQELRIDRPSQGSQLDLMRAAIDAKFGTRTAPRTGDDAVQTARDAVEEAQRETDAAATRLADARNRIAGFEEELLRRAEGEGAVDARREAAAALDAQVASLERRLTEAEATARDEIDESTRALSQAEHQLEDLRRQRRDDERRFRSLAASVTGPEAPPASDDLDAASVHVAAALRSQAAELEADIDGTGQAVDALDSRISSAERELDRHRSGQGGIAAEDRCDALVALSEAGDDVLVLDDVVAVGGPITPADLDVVELDLPVVVLTSEPEVVGWAIELPADRGQVVHADLVEGALAGGSADPLPDPHRTTRSTLECSP